MGMDCQAAPCIQKQSLSLHSQAKYKLVKHIEERNSTENDNNMIKEGRVFMMNNRKGDYITSKLRGQNRWIQNGE